MGPRGPAGPPGKNGDDVSEKNCHRPTRRVSLGSTERVHFSNRVMLENPAVLESVELLALRWVVLEQGKVQGLMASRGSGQEEN